MSQPIRRDARRKQHRPAILFFIAAALCAVGVLAYAITTEPERESLVTIERGERIQGLSARMRTSLAPAPQPGVTSAPAMASGGAENLADLLAAEREKAATAERERMEALLAALRADRQEADAKIVALADAQARSERLFEERLQQSLSAEREKHALQLAALEAEQVANAEAAARAMAERDAAERARLEREAAEKARKAHEARLQSDAVLVDDGGFVAIVADAGSAQRTQRRLSADEEFLAGAFETDFPTSRAQRLGGQDRLVAQGTLIQATLETAISSELPGMIRAVVAEPVWSFDGSKIVIPQGSRLIGRYSAETRLGQERVLAAWTRLIRPDGASIALGSPASDALGQAGVTGDVDSRFGERFGAAALVSILSGIAGFTDDVIDEAAGAEIDIDVSGPQSAARSAFEQYLTLKPIIRVPPGAKISVFVARDLVF